MSETKYNTPKLGAENVICFTCSDNAVEPIVQMLHQLHLFGEIGSSRRVEIDWDGDGKDRVENISVNGITLDDWKKEWERLREARNQNLQQNNEQNEERDE